MSTKKVFVAKSTPVTFAEIPAYKPTTDFFSALETAASTSYKTANQYQINILPDFTPILMTILFHAKRSASLLESPDHGKVSIYTYVAYCLNLVYAFFLIHDYELNHSYSHYANDLLVHRAFEKYYDHLQSLPVPSFLVTIFERLQQTLLDKQKTILFTPSFNGFSHYTHFGRIFPIDIFLGIHDIIASYDARAPVLQNIQDYQLRTIFKITALDTTPLSGRPTNVEFSYLHSHFFASYFNTDPATASAPQSANTRLSQFLNATFQMEQLRNIQARQRATPIGINQITVATGFYNPYVVLMSLTSNNIAELTTVFDSVAAVINEHKLAAVNFSSCITQATSKSLIHGYSDFPSPHWNADFVTNKTHLPTLVRTVNLSPEDYATKIRFLTSFDPAAPLNTWTARFNSLLQASASLNAAGRTAINAAPTATLAVNIRQTQDHRSRVMLGNQDLQFTVPVAAANTLQVPAETQPAPTTPAAVTENNMQLHSFNTFNAADSLYPLVKYYDTIDFAPSSAHLSGLAGLIIYSEELCAATVPMLSSLSKCSDDNNQFLQSAVPYAATVLSIHFRSAAPVPTRAIARLASTALTQVCLTMYRRANVVYDNTVTPYSFDTGLRRINYGLTPVTDQSIPQFNQTFFGHNVSTGIQRTRSGPQRFSPPNTPVATLLVWSPYSYNDATLDLANLGSSHNVLNRIHFITNLRTLFGTHGQVYESASPIEAIPMP